MTSPRRRMKSRSRRAAAHPSRRPLLEPLEDRRMLATVEWISDSDGRWNDAANWSTGTVPGLDSDVIINRAGANPTVTVGSGTVSVDSIVSDETIRIDGGTLKLLAGGETSQFSRVDVVSGDLQIDEAVSFRDELFVAEGGSATLVTAVVNGDVMVEGNLLVYRNTTIKNNLNTTGTSNIWIIGHSIDAKLTVEQGFTNRGDIDLRVNWWSNSTGGSRVNLVVPDGKQLINEGTIRVNTPATNNNGDIFPSEYLIQANLSSSGVIDVQHNARLYDSDATISGTVELSSGIELLVSDDSDVVLDGGNLSGTGTLRVNKSAFEYAGTTSNPGPKLQFENQSALTVTNDLRTSQNVLWLHATTIDGTGSITHDGADPVQLIGATLNVPWTNEGLTYVYAGATIKNTFVTTDTSNIWIIGHSIDAKLTVEQGFTNRGDIDLRVNWWSNSTGGSRVNLVVPDGKQLINEGTIRVNTPATNNNGDVFPSEYLIQANLSSSGVIDVQHNARLYNSDATISGTVELPQGIELLVSDDSDVVLDGGNLSGTGTLRVNKSAFEYAGTTSNPGPKLQFENLATLTVTNDLRTSQNVLWFHATTIDGTGSITHDGADYVQLIGATLNVPWTNEGLTYVYAGATIKNTFETTDKSTIWIIASNRDSTLVVEQGFTNRGTIELRADSWHPATGGDSAYLAVPDGKQLVNEGLIRLNTPLIAFSDYQIQAVVLNTGTMDFTAGGRMVSGTLVNNGTVNVAADQELYVERDLSQTAGQLAIDGTLNLRNGSGTVQLDGGTLEGRGTVRGVTINNGATIHPGGPLAAGTLTLAGTYSQGPGGQTWIEVGGLDAGQSDRLHINSTASLDGNLQLSVIDGLIPRVGDRFDVVTYGSRDATNDKFATLPGQVVVTSKRLEPDYQANTLSLDTVFDAGSAAAGIDAGLAALRASLPIWGAAFTSDPALPVINDDLNGVFGLDAGGGPLQQIATPFVGTGLTSAGSLEEIRDGLITAGYSIECFDTQCSDAFVRASLAPNPVALAGSSEFDDQTHTWLRANGLAANAELDGVVEYQGTLNAEITFGLDDVGFFLEGGEPFSLQLSRDLGGSAQIADEWELTGNQMGLVTRSTSTAQASLLVDVVSGDAATRTRVAEFTDPAALFSTVADGNAQVSLDLTLTRDKLPLDYEFNDRWDFTVAANTVSVTATLGAASQDDFVDVLGDQLHAINQKALSTELKNSLKQLPIPLIGGTNDPRPSTSDEPTSSPVRPDKFWWDFALDRVGSQFSDIDRLKGQGIYYTEGDAILRAAELRAKTGALGKGIVIGVISDGVVGIESAQNSGDVPANFADLPAGSTDPWVKVLRRGSGSEGVAMMEIIRDVAPQTSLLFYGVAPTEANPASFSSRDAFVRGIDELRAAGADIIVDDIGFLDEPFFGDGYVGGKISGLVNAGAVYPDQLKRDVLFVTAAGNDAENHHQATFSPADLFVLSPKVAGDNVVLKTAHTHHNGNAVMEFTATDSGSYHIFLQWNDPDERFSLLRVYEDDGFERILNASSSGSRPAMTELSVDAALPGEVIRVVIVRSESLEPVVPTVLELFWSDGLTLADANPGDAAYGHTAVPNVLTVGAVKASDPDTLEPFSSWGPSTINGENAPRASLDVLGVDGVKVSGAGGFDRTFFGTSAAAPHAAGVAALLMELLGKKGINRADWDNQVFGALKVSADDLGPTGYDNQHGNGRIDAMSAAELLDLVPGVAPGVPDPDKPRGVNLLEGMGYVIDNVVSEDDLRRFLSGNQINTDLITLRQQIGPHGPSVRAGFGFNLGGDSLGKIDDMGVTGSVEGTLFPEFRYVFGLDEGGEFVSNESYFGGRVVAVPQGHVKFDPFDVKLGGQIIANPGVSFETLPERFAPGDLPGLLGDAVYSLGNVRATLRVDAELGFFDFVDVDGDTSNNTENGGDPFVISGTGTVNANFDTFDITSLDDFQFQFSNLELINPDVNQDGIHDFTLSAFLENVYAFGKDMLNGLGVGDYLGNIFGDPDAGDDRENVELPRGMLPDELPVTPETTAARQAILDHVQTSVTNSQDPDPAVINSIMDGWLGVPSAGGPGEGESPVTVFSRAAEAMTTYNRAKLIEALAASEHFRITNRSLNLADVARFDAQLEQLDTMLAASIRRAFDTENSACSAEMAGRPLTVSSQAIEHAMSAVLWAQTAAHRNLATLENGLQRSLLMDRLCVRVVIETPDDKPGFVDDEGNFAARVGLDFRDANGNFGFPYYTKTESLVLGVEVQRSNNLVSTAELRQDQIGEITSRIALGDDALRYRLRVRPFLRTVLEDGKSYEADLPAHEIEGFTLAPTLTVDLESSDLDPTEVGPNQRRLVVNPNENVTFRVQLKHGNGGIPNAVVGINLQTERTGGYDCSAIEIGRDDLGGRQAGSGCGAVTNRDGTFHFTYQAGPSVQSTPDTLLVVYVQDGRPLVERIDIVVGDLTNDSLYELIGRPLRPQFDYGEQSPEESDFRAELNAELADDQNESVIGDITDAVRDALRPHLQTWYNAFTGSGLLDLAGRADATLEQVRRGLGEFASWRSVMSVLGLGDIDAGTARQLSRDAILRHFNAAIARINPNIATPGAGLEPIYDAARWALTAESLGIDGPDLSMTALVDKGKLSIEWSPQLAGYPVATLNIPDARLKIDGVTPAFPVPIQVLVRPHGTSTTDTHQGYLDYEPSYDNGTVELDEVAEAFTARIARGDSVAAVAATVHAGIPGIPVPIATEIKQVETDAELKLFARLSSQQGVGEDVTALTPTGTITVPAGQTLILRAELKQGDAPLQGALIDFPLTRKGSLNKRADLTDANGMVEFVYSPPKVGDASGDHRSIVHAQFTLGGKVQERSILIRYTPWSDGADDPLPWPTSEAQQALNSITGQLNVNASGEREYDEAAVVQFLQRWYGETPGVLSRLDQLASGNIPATDAEISAFDAELQRAFTNLTVWYGQTLSYAPNQSFASQYDEAKLRLATAVRKGLESMQTRCQAIAAAARNQFDLNIDALANEIDRASKLIEMGTILGLPDIAASLVTDQLSEGCFEIRWVDTPRLTGPINAADVFLKAGIYIDGVPDPFFSNLIKFEFIDAGDSIATVAGADKTGGGFLASASVQDGSFSSTIAAKQEVTDFSGFIDIKFQELTFVSEPVFYTGNATVKLAAVLAAQGVENVSNNPGTAVDGERVIVEATLRRGTAPLAGQAVYFENIGPGAMLGGQFVTNDEGKVRLIYYPPADKVGNTQIGVSYFDGQRDQSDTIRIEFDTTVNNPDATTSGSEAEALAKALIGRVVGEFGAASLVDNTAELDHAAITQALVGWLDADQTNGCGVRCLLVQAQADYDLDKFSAAMVAYLNWLQMTDITAKVEQNLATSVGAVAGEFTTAMKAAISYHQQQALGLKSGDHAIAAIELAASARDGALIVESDSEYALYAFDAVKAALKYVPNIAITFVGDPTDARLQIVVKARLDGQAATQTRPFDLEIRPLGRNSINGRSGKLTAQTNEGGAFVTTAALYEGDTHLQVVVSASPSRITALRPVVQQSKPVSGATSLTIGGMVEGASSSKLTKTLSLPAGKTAVVQGLVKQGLGVAANQPIMFSLDAGQIEYLPDRLDSVRFTPPSGEGTVTIVAIYYSGSKVGDGRLSRAEMTIDYGAASPDGENAATESARSPAFFNNILEAMNTQSLPFSSDDIPLGDAAGFGGSRVDGSSSFKVLSHIEFSEVLDWFQHGLPIAPQELVRVKVDLAAVSPAPGTLFDADLDKIMPDGWNGRLSLDNPLLEGNLVFGVDTSFSPFYLVTQPNAAAVQAATTDEQRADAAAVTHLTSTLGIGIDLALDEPLLGGALKVDHASGHITTKVDADFSRVAAGPEFDGKLRLHQFDELANVYVTFPEGLFRSFEGVIDAEIQIPGLDINDPDTGEPATLDIIGTVRKRAGNESIEFELRSGGAGPLADNIRQRLATDKAAIDDYEENDTVTAVAARPTGGGSPNLGTLTAPWFAEGLTLADQADWYRFETTEEASSQNYVQIDFDHTRGDLDLAVYRRDAGGTLVEIGTDGLSERDTARISLWGEQAGTFYVKVFDGRNPYYALSIDPPGTLHQGVAAEFNGFELSDLRFVVGADTGGHYHGELEGQLEVPLGTMSDANTGQPIKTEIGFHGELNNQHVYASLYGSVGGDAVATLAIPTPAEQTLITTDVETATGGFIIFDYQNQPVRRFKFAGFDAATSRWVIGEYDETTGDWSVPATAKVPANTGNSATSGTGLTRQMQLTLDGNRADLSVMVDGSYRLLVSQRFSGSFTDGKLGLGQQQGTGRFSQFTVDAMDSTGEMVPVFVDKFNDGLDRRWGIDELKPSSSEAGAVDPPSGIQSGFWSIKDDRLQASSTQIKLGDWLLVDSATLRGTIDIPFVQTTPPAFPPVADLANVQFEVGLFDANAVLGVVKDGGMPLYPGRPDSPQGWVALRDFSAAIVENGAEVSGTISAGIKDVVFFTLENANLDLTNDLGENLFEAAAVKIDVPFFRDDTPNNPPGPCGPGDAIVCLYDGDDTKEEPILAISKPEPGDLIPEFKFLRDDVQLAIDVNQFNRKFGLAELLPVKVEKFGLEFNDKNNLADISLLVDAQIDTSHPSIANLPFTPIISIGSAPLDANGLPKCKVEDRYELGNDTLSCNGFLSAKLHLPSLVGQNKLMVFEQLGPIHLGFANVNVANFKIGGSVYLGAFNQGVFDGQIGGQVKVEGTGASTFAASLAAAGTFVTNQSDDATITTLELNWHGQGSGSIGQEFGIGTEDADIKFNMTLQNTATLGNPIDLNGVCKDGETPVDGACPIFRMQSFETGQITIDLGPYATLSGSAEFDFTKTGGPSAILDEFRIKFKSELGDLAGVELAGGGIGVGLDGSIYLMPKIPSECSALDQAQQLIDWRCKGAFAEIAADNEADGAMFGLPEWFPVQVNRLGVRFKGEDADGDGTPDPLDLTGDMGLTVETPLANPANFSLIFSGGLMSSPDGWPINANVDNLEVDLGALAGCVAHAVEKEVGGELRKLGLFSAPCEFPIKKLEGVSIGVEPFSIGPIRIGGGIGLGLLEIDRDPGVAYAPERVLYGHVNGQLDIKGIGIGAELILTQYGPVLARLYAGVPVPIGTIVGGVIGSLVPVLGTAVGSSVGTQSGFVITGFQGGLVFDAANPLPQIDPTNPQQLLDIPQFRYPLRMTRDDIIKAITPLVELNPSFSEIVEDIANCNPFLRKDDTAECTLPSHFTWENGFRLVIGGTLTNVNVYNQIGAAVTLGANIGYGIDPEQQGFQLFGTADLEVLDGHKLAGAGILLDLSAENLHTLSPTFVAAARFPADSGWLSLLMPAQGRIGITLETDGYVLAQIVATQIFFKKLFEGALDAAGPFFDAVMERIATRLEADRRAALDLPLDDLELPDTFEADPERVLWQILLDTGVTLDANGNSSLSDEEMQRPITPTFLRQRLLGNGNPGDADFVPPILTLGVDNMSEIQVSYASAVAGELSGMIMEVGLELIGDVQPGAESNIDLAGIDGSGPLFDQMVERLRTVHEATLLGVDDPQLRAQLVDAFNTSINTARIQTVMAKVLEVIGGAASPAIDEYFRVLDPSLTIKGQMQPVLLGIPIGSPREEVDIRISKKEVTIRAKTTLLDKLQVVAPLPIPASDEVNIDVHIPFDNLLRDLFTFQPPKLDMSGADWRVDIGGSVAFLDVAEVAARGLLFGENAGDLLFGVPANGDTEAIEGKVQWFDPNVIDPDSFVFEPDKILVPSEFQQRLLDHGGIIVDGRMTLPRLITDPLELFGEIVTDWNGICPGTSITSPASILSCIQANPGGFFEFIGGLSGQLTSRDIVAQIQAYVPNFLDDIVRSLGTSIGNLDSSSDLREQVIAAMADMGEAAISEVFENYYLVGQWGQIYDRGDLDQIILPTSSKILGIELGNGRIRGEGDKLEIQGSYMGLADLKFAVDLNTKEGSEPFADVNPANGKYDVAEDFADANGDGVRQSTELFDDVNGNGQWDSGETYTDANGNERFDSGLPRAAAAAVFGTAPAGCNVVGTGPAGPITQITDLLANIGLGNGADPFDWIELPNVGAGACLRAYSPGYDLQSDDPLKRSGGIELLATVSLPTIVDQADLTFRVTPAADGGVVPDFRATGTARNLTIPGLPITVGPGGVRVEMEKGPGGLAISLDAPDAEFLGMRFSTYGQLSVDDQGAFGVLDMTTGTNDNKMAGLLSGSFRVFVNASFESGQVLRQPGTFKIEGQGQLHVPLLNALAITADGRFSIESGGNGLHVSGQGALDLFGAITATMTSAEFDIDSAGISDVDINGTFDIRVPLVGDPVIATGAGTLHISSGDSGLDVLGTFDGEVPKFPEIVGTAHGEFDERGCVQVEYLDVAYFFEVPGGGCDPVLTILPAPNPEVLENDNTPQEIVFTVEDVPQGDDQFWVKVLFDVYADSNVTYTPSNPSELILNSANNWTQKLAVTVINDLVFEAEGTDKVRISFDELNNVTWTADRGLNFGRKSTEFSVLNEDAPFIDYPNDSIAIYDFEDRHPDGFEFKLVNDKRKVIDFNNFNDERDFTGSALSSSGTIDPVWNGGRPDYYVSRDGVIVGAASPAGTTSNGSGYEFQVRPTTLPSGEFRSFEIEGIDFWSRLEGPGSQSWQLLVNGFELASTETATTTTHDGWTHFKSNTYGWYCTNGPANFRLQDNSGANATWIVDNIAIRGKEKIGGCGADLEAEIRELEMFDERDRHKMPYDLTVPGLDPVDGFVEVLINPGSNGEPPNVQMSIHGATSNTQVIPTVTGSALPSELVHVTIRTDGEISSPDFTDVPVFYGHLALGGASANTELMFSAILDGSTISVSGGPSQQLGALTATQVGTAGGSGVSLTLSGGVGSVTVESWNGGDVAIAGSAGDWTATTGNVAPDLFEAGELGNMGAVGARRLPGDGEGETMPGSGSISGVFRINGDVGRIEAIGGTVDLDLEAGSVHTIQATTRDGRIANLAGNYVVDRIENFRAIGGDLTASLTTRLAETDSLNIGAYRVNGIGGRIDSPNSFHIAGGIKSIVANEMQIRVEAGGAIGRIAATADPLTGNPASLVGHFTASHVGRIEVRDGDAGFDLTTTGEFFDPKGPPAVESIHIDGGNWLGGTVSTMPGTMIDEVAVLASEGKGGDILDPLEINSERVSHLETGDLRADVVVHGNVGRAAIDRAFGELIVGGSIDSFTHRDRVDTNGDTVVTPIDVLLIINHLNVNPRPATWSKYLDTTGDLLVTPLDALLVINRLNTRGAAEGEALPHHDLFPTWQSPVTSSRFDSDRTAPSREWISPVPSSERTFDVLLAGQPKTPQQFLTNHERVFGELGEEIADLFDTAKT